MADDGSASPADVPTPGDEAEGLLPESAGRPAEPPVQPTDGAPNAEETAAALISPKPIAAAIGGAAAEGGAQTPGAARKILVRPANDRKENEEGSGQGAPQDGDDQAPEPAPGVLCAGRVAAVRARQVHDDSTVRKVAYPIWENHTPLRLLPGV